MLNLQNASAITMFKFFGIPASFVEDLFSKLHIETIGDLKCAINEKPITFNMYAKSIFTKKHCQEVIMKTEALERKYNLRENANIPFKNLNMISAFAREASEKNTKGNELLLSSIVGQDGRSSFNGIISLNVSEIKKLFYYQNSSSKPLILEASQIGSKNLQAIINAINLFDEQLIRQNEEEHNFGEDLFHLNYEEKKAIVLDEISSYIDYLEENAENCVWGINNESKIRFMRESLISKSVIAIRNKERLINTFTNYTTLTELEKGVVKNKTLDRFIIN